MAFILGRDNEHWATYNRGASWGSWTFPEGVSGREPSLASDQVMGFHATQHDWVLFQAKACEALECWEETYYTQDGFRSPPRLLLPQTSSCIFAHSSKSFTAGPDSQVFCIAFDKANKGWHSLKESRLYTSDTWFPDGAKQFVDLGIGKRAQGVVGLGTVSKYLVVALKSDGDSGNDPMHLYTSTDGTSWHLARFPHSALPTLKENAYTIVESTTHSLAIDILTDPRAEIGTLFVSSADGIFFVQALEGTNRNEYGIVDYEGITGLEGVGLGNVVANRQEVVGWGEEKKLKSLMTFDDGESLVRLLVRLLVDPLTVSQEAAGLPSVRLRHASTATHTRAT